MQRFYQYNVGVAVDFDLNLLPLYRIQGKEIAQIPGLLAVLPPKRAARGREEDRLLVYLTLSGNTRFPSNEYKQIVDRFVQRFYQTSGSLTSAIRTAAGGLNQYLLKRNLRTTSKGEYTVGRLMVSVMRGAQIFFAQSGPTHVFHMTSDETRDIHDEQIAGRGLGISQTTSLYFAQAELHTDDGFVLCPNLPDGWEETILGEKNIPAGILRRNLLGVSNDDLNAVLIQVRAGKGNLNVLNGVQPDAERTAADIPGSISQASKSPEQPPSSDQAATQAQTPSREAAQVTPPAMPTSHVESERPASRFARILSGDEKSTPDPGPSSFDILAQKAEAPSTPTGQPIQASPARPSHRTGAVPIVTVAHPIRRTGRFVSARTNGEIPVIKRPVSRNRSKIFGGLANLIRGARTGKQKISDGTQKFIPKLLPNTSDDRESSGSTTALFAIIIPVIIVALAVTVYIHYGRTAQYQQYFGLALAQASQARGQTNPTEVRHAWDSTIYYLDLADKNLKTQDSSDLRQEAQTALDNLDGILRLDFRPAIIGGLSRSVQISHMAATDTDLYLLDASRGSVIRAFLTNQGYEVDASFQCDPGQHEDVFVGALVDLIALPMSNIYNARVMAIDGKGNLLYCGVADPVAVALVPPQLGWRNISAFSLDSDGKDLYVLDPAANAIWQYTGAFGKFPELPSLFFGEQVPQNMNTSIDLAANNADLYILFQDGHVSSCPLSHYEGVPMRCADPITFVDSRPERQSGPKINDAIFTQVSFASAPDPSLYMLEPLTRAIYRFSPRSDALELRGQFRATMEQNNTLFDGPATSMTIGPNRYAFFSVGSQVFYAADVP